MSNTENNNAPLNSNSTSLNNNNSSSNQGEQQQRGYRAGNYNNNYNNNNNNDGGNNNNNYRGGGRGGGYHNNNNNSNYRGGGGGRGGNNNYHNNNNNYRHNNNNQGQESSTGEGNNNNNNAAAQGHNQDGNLPPPPPHNHHHHHHHHHHNNHRGGGGNNYHRGGRGGGYHNNNNNNNNQQQADSVPQQQQDSNLPQVPQPQSQQQQHHHHHHHNNHRGGRGGRGGYHNNNNNQVDSNNNNQSALPPPPPQQQQDSNQQQHQQQHQQQQNHNNNHRGGGGNNYHRGGRGGGHHNNNNNNNNNDDESYNEYRRPPAQTREPRSNPNNQQYNSRPPRSASEEKVIEDLFTHRHKQTGTGINFERYAEIPVQISPKDIEPVNTFAELKLHELLMANINRAGYDKPSPVQKYGIPVTFKNKDIMGCAQTGSGKTAAFVLPIINHILVNGISHARGRTALPYAVILAPTRELADQIYKEALKFSFKTDVRPQVCYGGVDFTLQAANLVAGCDLIIATPGRLKDMYERKRIDLERVRFLVLDEADRMLDLGFEDDIRYIVSLTPGTDVRQTMLYSATFPKPIQILARQFLKPDFYLLKVGRVGSTTKNIVQRINAVSPAQKTNALLRIINSSSQTDLILVFVATKAQADELSYALRQEQLPCTSIHGDRKQYEREDALEQFKKGEIPIMIATDVASRGLDIPNVSHVIQYDLPNTLEDYTHRIGRTGRAGNQGIATAFFCDANRGLAPELYNYLKEHEQEVPEFLEDAVNDRFAEKRVTARGGRRGGRGGNNHADSSSFAPDPNKSWGDRNNNNNGGGGRGGNRGGGGGGNHHEEGDFFNDAPRGGRGRGGGGGGGGQSKNSTTAASSSAFDDGGF